VSQIIDTISAYLLSVQTAAAAKTRSSQIAGGRNEAVPILRQGEPSNLENRAEVLQSLDQTEIEAQNPAAAIINLIHVPGPQQVLLKVQVAELNRTALRNLSVSMLFQNDGFAIGSGVGPRLLNRTTAGGGAAATDALLGLINPLTGGTTSTLFGVFDQGGANVFVDALRRNQVLKILAEPNLVAMNGQEANFLSGGEFPVPVPQPSSTGVGLVTIQFKPFGVGLKFVPYILDDGKVRLSVAPEVSSIDFNTGIVIQGTSVPGINTRRTSTTVELQEGQTLAISGILQVTIDGTTARIPGLGDLPYIGALFSNNSSETVEKELVVLVTPYLVKAMEPEQVPELPGADVLSPDDCEFYLQGRIEKRACRPYRATTAWDDPLGVQHRRRWESQQICGPYGYTE
jgi:pilus assembly protein CpaC